MGWIITGVLFCGFLFALGSWGVMELGWNFDRPHQTSRGWKGRRGLGGLLWYRPPRFELGLGDHLFADSSRHLIQTYIWVSKNIPPLPTPGCNPAQGSQKRALLRSNAVSLIARHNPPATRTRCPSRKLLTGHHRALPTCGQHGDNTNPIPSPFPEWITTSTSRLRGH
ncbi:hypothetical protein B0T19DRAFT_115916 [Cercophora scortea]|uniref:Uncharacterized protein n=1 Tax=Cercophora scortea TaxID=314031 RepID=A0AAE0MJ80_9PEZI|nr:hypothetical protein B0T19DRAFT_115916 [Cercophora scortea]